jgi:hypothetical protein
VCLHHFFYLFLSVQTVSGAHSGSCPLGGWGGGRLGWSLYLEVSSSDMKLITHLQVVSRLRMNRIVHPLLHGSSSCHDDFGIGFA